MYIQSTHSALLIMLSYPETPISPPFVNTYYSGTSQLPTPLSWTQKPLPHMAALPDNTSRPPSLLDYSLTSIHGSLRTSYGSTCSLLAHFHSNHKPQKGLKTKERLLTLLLRSPNQMVQNHSPAILRHSRQRFIPHRSYDHLLLICPFCRFVLFSPVSLTLNHPRDIIHQHLHSHTSSPPTPQSPVYTS